MCIDQGEPGMRMLAFHFSAELLLLKSLHGEPTIHTLVAMFSRGCQALDWALLPRAALGVLALLCGNGFIVGINQVYDVDIDAVNKPFLPVAAGAAPIALRADVSGFLCQNHVRMYM